MGKFIRVPLTEQMEEDYRQCNEMSEYGMEKDCDGCRLNAGYMCLGEYPWCAEGVKENSD